MVGPEITSRWLVSSFPILLNEAVCLSEYTDCQRSKEEKEFAGRDSQILKPSLQIVSVHPNASIHSPPGLSFNALGLMALQASDEMDHSMPGNISSANSQCLFVRP